MGNIKKKRVKKTTLNSKSLTTLYHNAAGIDIGSKEIFVAVPINDKIEVQSFGTTTPQLRELSLWLKKNEVTSAAMEATGVYWVPLFEILSDFGIKPFLVDAKSVKNVPGKKTDVLDCQWIQKIYSCGLLQAAFRPSKDKESFRQYVRHRDNLIKERSRAIKRMLKALLLMNIKLDVAVSDITGLSGITIIRAIVNGERDPQKLAKLRNRNCTKTEEEFIEALDGNYQNAHLFALKQNLEIYDFYQKKIEESDKEIQKDIEIWPTVTNEQPPQRDKDKISQKNKKISRRKKVKKNEYNFGMRELLYSKLGVDLTSIPSISEGAAAIIVSELGGDINAFPSEKHWSSWLGVCPGNNVTGGKSRGGKTKKCRNRIKQVLCVAAMTLHHSKSALGAHFRRLKSRMGVLQATKAMAHKLGKLVYRIMKYGDKYVEIGEKKYNERYEQRRVQSLHRIAKELGYTVVRKLAA